MGARVFVAALALSAAPAAWSQGVPRPARPATSPPAVQQQASEPRSTPSDSITLRIVDTELRSAVQILQQYFGQAGDLHRSGRGADGDARDRRTRSLELTYHGSSAACSTHKATSSSMTSASGDVSSPSKGSPAGECGVLHRRSHHRSYGTARALTTRGAKSAGAFRHRTQTRPSGRRRGGRSTRCSAGTNGAQMNNSSSRTPTLSDQLRTMQAPVVEAPLPQSIPGTAGRPATLSGDLTIVPDSHGNNLLIRATRADFELIKRGRTSSWTCGRRKCSSKFSSSKHAAIRSFSLGVRSGVKDHHIGDGGGHDRDRFAFTPRARGPR